MRFLLSLLLLAGALSPQQIIIAKKKVGGAPVFVGSAQVDNIFDTTCVVTRNGVSAGNHLVLVLSSNMSSDVITGVSGTNTYSRITNTLHSNAGITLVVYKAENSAAGNETVTVSLSASKSMNCALLEYSGVLTSGSLDQSASGHNAGSTATDGDASPSVTTTTNNQLIIGVITETSGAGTSFVAGTGFTLRANGTIGTAYHNVVIDKVQAAAGSISATWTADNSANYNTAIATFKSQ